MDRDAESKRMIAAYLAGDDQALQALVHAHLAPLYNFVFLIVRDRDSAEDIVQETFIKAWKHLERFDTSQKFKTWLYTIAKNTAFDALKKKKALPFSAFTDVLGETPFDNRADGKPEILETIAREETLKHLEAALDQVPLLYRTLLLLVYREDFDLQEAAHILGEPYNTIKSRHQRALGKLKAVLGAASASQEDRASY